MKQPSSKDGWEDLHPAETMIPGNKQSNQNQNQMENVFSIPKIHQAYSELKQAKNVLIKNDYIDSDQKVLAKKDYLIPEHNLNISFCQDVSKFIDRKTQNHIKNWKTYQKDSQDIQNLYSDLEYEHAFIQWIFPNFFNSMFNPNSRRLTLEERNEIIASEEYTAFYLDNFRMFMRFLGIDAKIDKSDYQFELIDETQFQVCVFENTHNLMRIQRVFASLSVLGQRELALNFLDFLKKTLDELNQQQLKDNKIRRHSIYNNDEYANYYRYFERVKEEEKDGGLKSSTTFDQTKNFYFQKDLLEKWNVNANILTKKQIQEDDFNKDTLNYSQAQIQLNGYENPQNTRSDIKLSSKKVDKMLKLKEKTNSNYSFDESFPNT